MRFAFCFAAFSGLICPALTPAASAQATSGAIISEFRFRGATGPADEYVELVNTLTTPLDVSGWGIQTNTGTSAAPALQTSLIAPNTVIPARGHFLFAGSGYSLGNYAPRDALIAGDASDDSGVALFNAAGALQDAVGFASSTLALREGAGLASAPTANSETAFVRIFAGSIPKDTPGDSTQDFEFVQAEGTASGQIGVPDTLTPIAGTNGAITGQLGAPSPQSLLSPYYVNNRIVVGSFDPTFAATVSPNRVRTGDAQGVFTDRGTLLFRKTITNKTGATITKLRVSVTQITTLGSPVTLSPQADIRLISVADEPDVPLTGASAQTVFGTSVESGAGQPLQPLSGGQGSSAIVSIPPLANNTKGNFAFLVQVKKSGNFSINLNVEALSVPKGITDLSAYLGDRQAALEWSAASTASSYKIERKEGTGGTYAELATRPTAPTYTDTGLTNGVTYFYRVYAINETGTSPASNEVSVTPAVVVRGVDLSVGVADPLTGVNAFYPDAQLHTLNSGVGAPAIFRLVVQNTGNTRDTFRLSGRGDTPGWKVRYFDAPSGGAEISSLVKPNGYLVTLAGLAKRELRIEVAPDASVPQNEAKDVPVSARSEGDTLYTDQITAQAVQANMPPPPPTVTYGADASIRLASAQSYNGVAAVSPVTPDAAQTLEGVASSDSAAVYNWRVQNTGSATDGFRLSLTPSAVPAGWTVSLFDALDGGTDITAATQNGSRTVSLAPGAYTEMRLEVRPGAGTGGTLSLLLGAASSGDPNRSDVCAANTSAMMSTMASPVVTFSGTARAAAGGLASAIHQSTLMLNATQGGAPVPPGTSFTLSFENNVGHNYGTLANPSVSRRAKIYDPNDAVMPWKETLTVTTDINGQVPAITLLSSDVISQPRLIARWTSAGNTETVGGVKFDCAAAISKRGVVDPVDPEDPDWQANDTGWSVEIGSIEKPGDICNGSVTMQVKDVIGVFQKVAGHTLLMRIAKISLSNDQDVYDLAEMGRYLRFFSSGQESSTFTDVTDAAGVLNFSLRVCAQRER